MSLFFLVRHGQTQWNTEKRLQGHRDSPLTDLGRRQAQALAQKLQGETFHQVWTSTSGRAKETAAILGFDHPRESDELREMNLGTWEGLTKDEVGRTWGQGARFFWEEPHKFEPFGGESFAQAQTRLVHFFHRLAGESPRQARILVVSHGMAIQLFLNAVEGLGLKNLYHQPVVHQASLSLVENLGPGTWKLHYRDSRDHLGPLVQTSGQVV